MLEFNEICIGVSTYNGEKTLERTLKCLEDQTFKNFSVFISDDKSTDNTLDIIKNFSKRNKNFYFEINEKNLGMILNNNKVFKKSNSKYFAWLDQDDYRDKDFLKECYNTLEANPNASLVFPNTGVVNKKDNILMHINTIKSIENENDIYKRYKNLLNNFHDTIIYSLIRTSSLKNTSLWTDINGSANRLIFELVLEGEFVAVNKLLSFYSGRGLKNRFNSDVEFFRQSKYKKKFYQLPFLMLFFSQLKDVINKKLKFYFKIRLIVLLIFNFLKVNTLKLLYRFFSKIFFGKLDNYIYKLILKIVPENKDINQIVNKKLYNDFYPIHYPFKKVEGIKND